MENKFENNAYLKKGYFGPTFRMVPSEKRKKFLRHISHLHKYTYLAHPIDFFAFPILQKKYEFIMYGFSLVRFMVLIFICANDFGAINK